MAGDIVERLREFDGTPFPGWGPARSLMEEAADVIERLRLDNEQARQARLDDMVRREELDRMLGRLPGKPVF